MRAFCLLVSWVLHEGVQFTENMYVLEKGEYPTKEAMGLTSSHTPVRSIQSIGHVRIVDVLQVAHHVSSDDHSAVFLLRSCRCPPLPCFVRWTSKVAESSSPMEQSTCSRWAWTQTSVPWWWTEECKSLAWFNTVVITVFWVVTPPRKRSFTFTCRWKWFSEVLQDISCGNVWPLKFFQLVVALYH